jgi:hypothetical protein
MRIILIYIKRMEIDWSEGDIWDLMKENNGNGNGNGNGRRGYVCAKKLVWLLLAGWLAGKFYLTDHVV